MKDDLRVVIEVEGQCSGTVEDEKVIEEIAETLANAGITAEQLLEAFQEIQKLQSQGLSTDQIMTLVERNEI